ncbi:MAG: efflux RND transporter permease subunit [Alphaproteobacteria bacterium]
MTLIDAALNRSRTIIATLALLLIAGTVAYITIPKESDPDINIPIIYVSLSHEGISPEDAERLLVRPIEEELRSIEGVKEMRSTAYQGGANVLLEFDAGFDADRALDDVREGVDVAKPDLPEDTDEPTVNEVNFSLFPVLVVTLSGDVPERALTRLARDLRDKIEGLPSVLEVNIGGDREEQVEIIVDPMLVESYALEATELLNRLDRSNRLIAAGALDTGQGRFAVKVPGLFESVEDIFAMPVAVGEDAVVTLADIATVRRTFKDRETYARVNGRPAVALEVTKRSGENIIETVAAVRDLVKEESKAWQEGIVVSFSQDQSSTISQVLSELQNSVLSAILLVMIVVVGALGLRSGILVAVAIPGSFLTAILVLQLLGLTVNIVVLFSLILAVGMLVDGAIVVTEYADRKLREGEPPERAYTLAAKRMAWPIIASTATTLAAFAPLLFWPGLVGEFMKFLPITLVATLSASLAMALVFVPIVGANLGALARMLFTLVGVVAGGAAVGGAVFAARELNLISLSGPLFWAVVAVAAIAGAVLGTRLGLKVGARVSTNLRRQDPDEMARMRALAAGGDADAALRGGTALYVRVLRRALHYPGIVLAGALLVLIGSWWAYATFGRGIEFFPDVEPDHAVIQVHARGNLSVAEKAALVSEVEGHILDVQSERGEFRSVYALSGNLGNDNELAEDVVGTISLEFVDWELRRPADEILADIVERTSGLAGILVETRKEEAGPPVGKPIQVQLSSRYPERLAREIEKVRAFVEGLDGLKDIEDSRPTPGIEWELRVDRAQAAKFDADVTLIGNAIKLTTNGMKVSAYRPDDSDDEIEIVARYPPESRTIDQLDQIRVATGQGLVPIGNFVERRAIPRTGLLRRVDGQRVMTVQADILPGVLVDDRVQAIKTWLATAEIEPAVEVAFKGEDLEQKDAEAFLKKAFAVALFIMAVILVTQFNSFYSAFLILSAVVMSTIGVMLGLLIIQRPFGIVMSGVGVIALAGIVVNNNIVLIDTFDRLRKTIPDPMEAIIRTGAQRLRPVLLTTVTTILGLMPMVLQVNIDFVSRTVTQGAPSTQWWVQLASAIVSGLAFATVLTLIVTPCSLMVRENLRRRRSGSRAAQIETTGTVTLPSLEIPKAAE